MFKTSIDTEDPVEIIANVTNGKIDSFEGFSKEEIDDVIYITDEKGDLYFYYNKSEINFDGDKITVYMDDGKIIGSVEGSVVGFRFVKDGEAIEYSEEGDVISRKVYQEDKIVNEQ